MGSALFISTHRQWALFFLSHGLCSYPLSVALFSAALCSWASSVKKKKTQNFLFLLKALLQFFYLPWYVTVMNENHCCKICGYFFLCNWEYLGKISLIDKNEIKLQFAAGHYVAAIALLSSGCVGYVSMDSSSMKILNRYDRSPIPSCQF